MLPNFLVIGAPKAATTAICTHLSRHPEVFFSYPKEPFFFAYDDVYANGIEWYERLFDRAAGAKAIGEGSTVYAQLDTFPHTLDRIEKHLNNVKFIYAVREPLERIRSHWVEMYSQGLTMLPFNDAVRAEGEYLDASRYHRQLAAYSERFGRDSILVLFYEDFVRDPAGTMRTCFEFLDVDPTFQVPDVERPIYASDGKRADLPLTNFLRRSIPGFLSLRNAAPAPVRDLVKRVFKREIPHKPEWEDATKRYVVDALQDDIRQFLQGNGKSPDYWRLTP